MISVISKVNQIYEQNRTGQNNGTTSLNETSFTGIIFEIE